jgi:GT2 family glycosyltransferase
MRRRRSSPAPGQPCPKVAAILCLRGRDPFLEACLRALLNQDYPRYEVRVIVDCREDAAWQAVEAVAREYPAATLQIMPLTQPRRTCSLKCSSVVQAISALDESYDVAALLDADTVPHRTWLRELVAPLADPRVGATTGNRWYLPADASWAGLVRYLWNAAAIVQMYCYRIPWGGTLALKMQILRQSDLLDRWQRAFCEDTMLYGALRRQGFRVQFVPSLMMVNREACSMAGFFGWVRRQLLTARLYHPGWPAVVAHGLGTFLLLTFSAGLLLAALGTRHWGAVAWLAAGLACYLALLPCLLLLMEQSVRRIVRARGEPTAWLSAAAVAKIPPAILLTQGIYTAALVSALFLRNVQWRGIRYRVDGPWQIRMLEYRPYETPNLAGETSVSL